MRYQLSWYLERGEKQFLEIPESQAARIKDSVKAIVSSYYVEQRFDMFLSNYIECETLAANLAIDLAVRSGKFWENTDLARSQTDRVVMNLLMSGTAYKAQVQRFGTSDCKTELKKIFDDLRDSSWPYRAIAAVRNYAQHFSLPVHSIAIPSSWVGEHPKNKGKQRRHSFELYMDLAELKEGLTRDRSLLSEFESSADQDGKIAILPLLRRYIEDISTAHAAVRKLVAQRESLAASELEAARRLAFANGTAGTHLMLYELNDNEEDVAGETFLGSSIEKNLATLKSRNRVPLTGFGFVTFSI